MRQTEDTNRVAISGTAAHPPRFSHSTGGKAVYCVKLCSKRLSGNEDAINIMVHEALLEGLEIERGTELTVQGSMRSCNHLEGGRSRLILSVFARELSPGAADNENRIALSGTICKPPSYRVTPLGRELCDVMLAVRRRYGKSDFLPLIFWGRNAKAAAALETGTKITCEGRIQSREYIKKTEEGEAVKTAYEVSVSSLCLSEGED